MKFYTNIELQTGTSIKNLVVDVVTNDPDPDTREPGRMWMLMSTGELKYFDGSNTHILADGITTSVLTSRINSIITAVGLDTDATFDSSKFADSTYIGSANSYADIANLLDGAFTNYVKLDGSTPLTGNWNIGSFKISSSATATVDTDLVNLATLKSMVGSLVSWKPNVQGVFNVGDTFPTPVGEGDAYILVLDPSSTPANTGDVYTYNGSTWVAMGYPDGAAVIYPGDATRTNQVWIEKSNGAWEQFESGGLEYTFSDGLKLSGTAVSTNLEPNGGLKLAGTANNGLMLDSATMSSTIGEAISYTYLASSAVTVHTITHNLGTNIVYTVYDGAGNTILCDGVISMNTLTLTFSEAIQPKVFIIGIKPAA